MEPSGVGRVCRDGWLVEGGYSDGHAWHLLGRAVSFPSREDAELFLFNNLVLGVRESLPRRGRKSLAWPVRVDHYNSGSDALW